MQLLLLDRDINIIITKMKNSLKDFEVTKNKTKAAKQKYNESKTKYEKGIEEFALRTGSIVNNFNI